MGKVQIKISSDTITEQVVTPTWSGRLSDNLEDEQVFYRTVFADGFTFRGDDYNLIDGADDCELITLSAYQWCTDQWVLKFAGTFTKMDCDYDKIKCTLSVTPSPSDDYLCLYENWEDETEIYSASAVISTKVFLGTYESGLCDCYDCVTNLDGNYLEVDCYSGAYCFEEHFLFGYDTTNCPFEYEIRSCWHRVVGTGTSVDPPPYGTGWTYISGNDWWRCPPLTDIAKGKHDYGRLFNDVLETVITSLGCSLTVRSHFFDINATHTAAPSNDAYTFASENLQNMTVHQKSDVKRPYGSNPALSWVWKMKAKDLLEDLRTMFNVYFVIDGADIIIEHVSYFEATAGLDVTALAHPQEYEGSETAPEKEKFTWSDPGANYAETFAGWPIIYDCGEGVKEHRVNLFTTDILTVMASANAEDIADRNFVLMANAIHSGEYEIIDGNAPLGWEQLHDNLHRHHRLFTTGTIANQTGQTFLSTVPLRKIKEFKTALCCDDAYSPDEYVVTNLGNARIESATRDLVRDKISLNLTI